MPKNPKIYANIVEALASQLTPKKRAAVGDVILTPSKKRRLKLYDTVGKITTELKRTKASRSKDVLKRRKTLVSPLCHVGVSWSFLSKSSELDQQEKAKQRSDALDQRTIEVVPGLPGRKP